MVDGASDTGCQAVQAAGISQPDGEDYGELHEGFISSSVHNTLLKFSLKRRLLACPNMLNHQRLSALGLFVGYKKTPVSEPTGVLSVRKALHASLPNMFRRLNSSHAC
jgi:hypothetical protein